MKNIMSQLNTSVFICYRRANSFHALAVYQALSQRGFDVFMDYQNIDAGDFEHIILENIKARAHFIVILTPSALERCNETGDWLRREIEYALEYKRNIVPLMFEGFDYKSPSIAKYLNGSLQLLTRYNAQRVPADFFEAAMQKVSQRFLSKPVDTVIHPLSHNTQRITEQQKALANSQASVTEDTLSAEGHFEQALSLPEQDIDGKIKEYSRAIALRPDYADAYNNRGIALCSKGKVKQGVEDYHEAIRLKPNYADAYYNLGNVLLENGYHQHALTNYAKAIRLKMDYADAFIGGGLAYFGLQNYTLAVASYTKAIRLKPDSAKAYLNRGNVYFEKGQYENAIKDYDKSIALGNPELEVCYNNRGLAYYELGKTERAVEDFKVALRINPADDLAQQNLNMAQLANR